MSGVTTSSSTEGQNDATTPEEKAFLAAQSPKGSVFQMLTAMMQAGPQNVMGLGGRKVGASARVTAKDLLLKAVRDGAKRDISQGTGEFEAMVLYNIPKEKDNNKQANSWFPLVNEALRAGLGQTDAKMPETQRFYAVILPSSHPRDAHRMNILRLLDKAKVQEGKLSDEELTLIDRHFPLYESVTTDVNICPPVKSFELVRVSFGNFKTEDKPKYLGKLQPETVQINNPGSGTTPRVYLDGGPENSLCVNGAAGSAKANWGGFGATNLPVNSVAATLTTVKVVQSAFDVQGVAIAKAPEQAAVESWTKHYGENGADASKYPSGWRYAGPPGSTWIGKLQSNGPNDSHLLRSPGRHTIVYIPHSTDPSSPYEMIFWLHGLGGFRPKMDFKERLAPQLRKMIEQKRNFVLVVPQQRWSTHTYDNKKENREDRTTGRIKGRQSNTWSTNGSKGFNKYYEDCISVVEVLTGRAHRPTHVTLVGHSAGGGSIASASETFNDMKIRGGAKLTATPGRLKLVFSDSDYGVNGSSLGSHARQWQRGGTGLFRLNSKRTGKIVGIGTNKNLFSNTSALKTWEKLGANQSNVYFLLYAQDPSRQSAHAPTANALDFIASLGVEVPFGAPGIKPFSKRNITPPKYPKVIWMPVQGGHNVAGETSMALIAPNEKTARPANEPNQTKPQENPPTEEETAELLKTLETNLKLKEAAEVIISEKEATKLKLESMRTTLKSYIAAGRDDDVLEPVREHIKALERQKTSQEEELQKLQNEIAVNTDPDALSPETQKLYNQAKEEQRLAAARALVAAGGSATQVGSASATGRACAGGRSDSSVQPGNFTKSINGPAVPSSLRPDQKLVDRRYTPYDMVGNIGFNNRSLNKWWGASDDAVITWKSTKDEIITRKASPAQIRSNLNKLAAVADILERYWEKRFGKGTVRVSTNGSGNSWTRGHHGGGLHPNGSASDWSIWYVTDGKGKPLEIPNDAARSWAGTKDSMTAHRNKITANIKKHPSLKNQIVKVWRLDDWSTYLGFQKLIKAGVLPPGGLGFYMNTPSAVSRDNDKYNIEINANDTAAAHIAGKRGWKKHSDWEIGNISTRASVHYDLGSMPGTGYIYNKVCYIGLSPKDLPALKDLPARLAKKPSGNTPRFCGGLCTKYNKVGAPTAAQTYLWVKVEGGGGYGRSDIWQPIVDGEGRVMVNGVNLNGKSIKNRAPRDHPRAANKINGSNDYIPDPKSGSGSSSLSSNELHKIASMLTPDPNHLVSEV